MIFVGYLGPTVVQFASKSYTIKIKRIVMLITNTLFLSFFFLNRSMSPGELKGSERSENSLRFYSRRAEYITNIKERSVASSSSFISPCSSPAQSVLVNQKSLLRTMRSPHQICTESRFNRKVKKRNYISVRIKIIIIWMLGEVHFFMHLGVIFRLFRIYRTYRLNPGSPNHTRH